MATRRKRPAVEITPDDAALFRAAIGPVRELAATPDAPASPRPPPEPRQREADEAEALQQSRAHPFDVDATLLGETVEYLRAGHPPRMLQQLKRAQFSVQDEIDLHRMTAAVAETALRRFLRENLAAGHRCVRIVHGKGLRSGDEGPVLKGLVDRHLRQRGDVLAFASAPPAQGGSGAVLVLLARRRATAAGDDAAT